MITQNVTGARRVVVGEVPCQTVVFKLTPRSLPFPAEWPEAKV